MIAHTRKHWRAGSGGSAATEFAMIATLLLLMTFGVMTVGSAVYSYNTISNAAREAVRYAAVHSATSAAPATDDQIKQVAMGYAPGLNLTSSNVTVSWPADPNAGMTNGDAQVQISYTYNLSVPFMKPVALPLSSTSRMLVSQ